MTRLSRPSGFTLIEAIIASGIIVFGVVSMISLSLTSHLSAAAVSEEYHATTLAQEAIEAVRVVRDANWEKQKTDPSHAWDDGLTGTFNDHTAIFVVFDATRNPATDNWFVFDECDDIDDACALVMEKQGANIPLFQKTAASRADGTPTHFSRLITLTPLCRDTAGNEAVDDVCPVDTIHVGYDVVAEVTWPSRTGKQTAILQEHIYDWQ